MTDPTPEIAEVRAASNVRCDRFGNDPRRLPAHRRAEQCHCQGSVIKNWSEPQPAAALREAPPAKKGNE